MFCEAFSPELGRYYRIQIHNTLASFERVPVGPYSSGTSGIRSSSTEIALNSTAFGYFYGLGTLNLDTALALNAKGPWFTCRGLD